MFAGLMLKDSVDDLAARAVDREAEDMKYVLLMYRDPAQTAAMSAAERDLVARKHESLHSELAGSGELLNGAGLAYPSSTKTIRARGGVPAATDGPLAEAGIHLTAYHVIDCENAGRALCSAGSVLDFHVTAVELRPVHDSFGMDTPGQGG